MANDPAIVLAVKGKAYAADAPLTAPRARKPNAFQLWEGSALELGATIATMLTAAKEEIAPLLAACFLSRNSPPAHQLPTALLYPGIGLSISNTATGLATSLYDEGKRSRFTGKERDTESGFDYFGARFYGSALGRFTSPDPKGAGVNTPNPQSWNGYSYALNNPLVYIDPNGKWPFYVHNKIYEAAFAGMLDANQMKVLEHASLFADFGPHAQEPSMSFTHSMCSSGQTADSCSAAISGFLQMNLDAARHFSAAGTDINLSAVAFFGLAVHTLTDMGSPAHVSPEGMPYTWSNGTIEGLAHVMAERDDYVNWFDIGQSIRLAIAGFASAFPEAAKKHGNTDAWANKAIENYVDQNASPSGFVSGPQTVIHEMTRQCALGNIAACSH